MRDSSDENIRFLWQRLRVSTRADCSDAGMAYFLMTGDEQSEISKVRAVLEGKTIPAPSDPRKRVRIEAENFLTLDDFKLDFNHSYRSVSHRMNVELTGPTGRIRTPLEQPYTAPRGRYDVEVRYFDDSSGANRLAFYVNGRRRGATWRALDNDDAWKTRTISGVN
ncbi:MAG: hypothetical protein GY953_46795, partial [bacterium]|nr:hypothetical protein [bacterium]